MLKTVKYPISISSVQIFIILIGQIDWWVWLIGEWTYLNFWSINWWWQWYWWMCLGFFAVHLICEIWIRFVVAEYTKKTKSHHKKKNHHSQLNLWWKNSHRLSLRKNPPKTSPLNHWVVSPRSPAIRHTPWNMPGFLNTSKLCEFAAPRHAAKQGLAIMLFLVGVDGFLRVQKSAFFRESHQKSLEGFRHSLKYANFCKKTWDKEKWKTPKLFSLTCWLFGLIS